MDDLHPPDDYSHRFFIWHEWIQANGPLTAENAFDYFTTSMFYDKQSNNQVLRMQTIFTGEPLLNEAEELKRFTGVEFALVHAQPPSFFIIHKRHRLSPDEVRPLAAYFIMNNRIYESPDIYTVLSNRLLTSTQALQTSLDTLRAHRPDYTPRTGFIWPIIDNSITDKKPDDQDVQTVSDPGTPGSLSSLKTRSVPKRQQNTIPLFNAMRTTAAHTKNSLSLSTATASATAADTAPAGTPASTGPSPSTPIAPVPVNEPAPLPEAQPPVKGPVGAGKKKRKRTSVATPMSTQVTS